MCTVESQVPSSRHDLGSSWWVVGIIHAFSHPFRSLSIYELPLCAHHLQRLNVCPWDTPQQSPWDDPKPINSLAFASSEW